MDRKEVRAGRRVGRFTVVGNGSRNVDAASPASSIGQSVVVTFRGSDNHVGTDVMGRSRVSKCRPLWSVQFSRGKTAGG